MGQVFVRRTTAGLLFLVAALSILCVALLVMLLAPDWRHPGGHTTTGEHTRPQPTQPPSRAPVKPPSTTPEPKEPWEKNYRIPRSTWPHHYDLYLHPDLDTGRFTGRVAILIGVTAPTTFLVAHVKQMNITNTQLLEGDAGRRQNNEDHRLVPVVRAFEYEANQFWVTVPGRTLAPGNYTLRLDFEGSLDGSIVGFYRSVYTASDGSKRSIATSKFQPTDARSAFPCFDEPSFKSTFTTTLVRPSRDYVALSNMPVMNEIPDSPSPGLTEVQFERSVPMVTYLACFIVCDFDYVEVMTKDNKPFRVYSTKDQINRTQYSRDLGVDVLNYFEDYFEVEYPLPKQDMIAIPDFISGAMEHWGLITYREVNLLYDARGSSSYNQQRVAAVVAHELAHMWFGNLVTLEWWDDLWLNEGFASYIEYKGVNTHEPDWDMEGQFVVDDLQRVMILDAQLTSHPIVQAVNHPDEITEIFDSISYSKGASVLRMLEGFLNPDEFRIGVRNFLRRYKYANAVTKDLWTELEAVSGSRLNVSRIMDSWTRQMGYPVLEVKRVGQNQLEVRQKRFLADPEAESPDDSPYGYVWDVPVTYKTDQSQKQQVWFYREQEKAMLNLPAGSSWVKVNVDQVGYYRVNYDTRMWDDLARLLKTNHEALSPADRSSLLDDAFSLASSGHLAYPVALNLASYMTRERHYIPWKTLASHLASMGRLLRKTKAYPFFRKYVVGLVQGHVDRLGWEDTGSHLERRNRITLMALACWNGLRACRVGAYDRFQEWLRDPQKFIPPNTRSLVYQYGVEEAGFDEWLEVLRRYMAEVNAQEKGKLLVGLSAAREDWMVERWLEEAMNETIVRGQDYFSALQSTANNPWSTGLVWTFVKDNWEYLVDRFSLSNRYLGRMVKYVSTRFTTQRDLEDVQEFFKQWPEAGAGARAREQAVEELSKNIKWIAKHQDTLHDWFKQNM